MVKIVRVYKSTFTPYVFSHKEMEADIPQGGKANPLHDHPSIASRER